MKDVVEDAELCAAVEVRDVCAMDFPARLTSGAEGMVLDSPWPALVVAVALPPVLAGVSDCDCVGRGKPDLPSFSASNGTLNLAFAITLVLAVAVVLVDMLIPGLGGLA